MSDLKYRIIEQEAHLENKALLGLKSYMCKVYSFMFVGLSLTGLVAFAVTQAPALQNVLFVLGNKGYYEPSGLTWLLTFAQLGLVFFLSFRVNHITAATAQIIFWLYAGLMGLTLSSIFLVYTGSSLTRVFLVTSATFGAMSLYGYTTKKDLSSFGSLLFMGLFGVILASLVNIFLKSSMVEFVISALGVMLFTGLTAYDTQRIKEIYLEDDTQELRSKKAIMGALALYLDFVNIFLLLLRFLGDRR